MIHILPACGLRIAYALGPASADPPRCVGRLRTGSPESEGDGDPGTYRATDRPRWQTAVAVDNAENDSSPPDDRLLK
ncbi:hypothetical protein VTN96DRAFT_7493 [Rasamsonia emersonii]